MKGIKRISLLIIGVLLFVSSFPVFATQPVQEQELFAKAAVVMDAQTGQVLYGKNENSQMHPASITKIMTGWLVAEQCDLSETLSMSETAMDLPAGSARIGLKKGEEITLSDGMYAMMVASDNEVANALAEHLAGSQEEFVQLMNQRCEELGLQNTHFDNPHGLTSKTHQTTAYEMGLITQGALKNPVFLSYFGVPRHEISKTNKQNTLRNIQNHHYMLRPEMWAYTPEVIAGKTGYTLAAGNTLVTVAEKQGRQLICVVLGSTSDGKYLDTQGLLDYGFQQFENHTVSTAQISQRPLPLMDENHQKVGEAILHLPEEITVTLEKGTSPQLVEMKLRSPESVSETDPQTGYLDLSLSIGEGEEKPLREVPIEYEYLYLPVVEEEVEQILSLEEELVDPSKPEPLLGIVGFFGLISVIGGLVLWNKWRKQ